MKQKVKYITRFFLIVPILAVAMCIFTQCSEKQENDCEGALCTEELCYIILSLKYPDGQPVILDEYKVFWKSENRFLEHPLWNESRVYGCYVIVADDMQKELIGKQEIMHFTGYLNGEIVHEQDVLVGADCCHVNYLGAESLIQTIYGISDEVRENKFCELVNVEYIRDIIPSLHAFIETIDETEVYENKLEMIVNWFLSHSCITDARIDCVRCYSNDYSKIAFSFVENGQTVNMIVLVDDALRFRGLVSE